MISPNTVFELLRPLRQSLGGRFGSSGLIRERNLPIGCCPHTIAVYDKAAIKVLIYPYYQYYPTVTEWGQYLTYQLHDAGPLFDLELCVKASSCGMAAYTAASNASDANYKSKCNSTGSICDS